MLCLFLHRLQLCLHLQSSSQLAALLGSFQRDTSLLTGAALCRANLGAAPQAPQVVEQKLTRSSAARRRAVRSATVAKRSGRSRAASEATLRRCAASSSSALALPSDMPSLHSRTS